MLAAGPSLLGGAPGLQGKVPAASTRPPSAMPSCRAMQQQQQQQQPAHRAPRQQLRAEKTQSTPPRAATTRATAMDVPSPAAPTSDNGSAQEAQALLQSTRIAVFSAQQYVRDFMDKPTRGTFPNTTFIEAKLDMQTVKLAQGCNVVNIFVNDTCTEEIVKALALQGVKLISLRCAGFDRVDLKACAYHGIKVVRVPTYSPQSVAEHAVAHMFALNRNIANAHQRTVQGNYSLNGLVGFEMFNKTVGVISTGAIGYEACRILKGIGCNVIAFDVFENPKVKDLGIEYKSLEELLPLCDIVSLHCPLLPSTFHIINKDTIALMKPGAMLVNVSRGGLVDTDALFEGLESGQIGSVGLDVYEDEGDIFFVDHTMFDVKTRMGGWNRKLGSLLSYPQVLVTPHCAFLTHEALNNIANTTVENISNFVLNKPLGRNEVAYTQPFAGGA